MESHNKDLSKLYRFFVKEGFNHSMEEIAFGIQVTKKTLHNRYISKQNLESIVFTYWKSIFVTRFEEKVQFSNHSIETLLLLIYELELSIVNEIHFFIKESSDFCIPSFYENHFLIPFIVQVIKDGQQTSEMSVEIDPLKYARYFVFNLLNFLFIDSFNKIKNEKIDSKRDRISVLNQFIQVDYIEFLIIPLLTLKGKSKLKEIDLNLLFIVH